MRDKYPPLYLFTGIFIGIVIGLLVTFVLLPVRYSDTSPATLSETQRNVYRGLVGRAYLYEADSRRAFSRLALLQDSDLQSALVSQSQQMSAAGSDAEIAKGLSLLAGVFTDPNQVITPLVQSSEVDVPAQTITPGTTGTEVPTQNITPDATGTMNPTEATQTPVQPTKTSFATFTPRPSATPQPTQGAPYSLVSDPKTDCDASSITSQLMVYVYDANGNGISNVKIEISVPNGGSTTFFTGLYPEINNGYADYTMSPDTVYNLRVGIGGDIINGLSVPQCTASDGSTYSGNLVLTFKQQ
jgi:hypothetical protein